MDRLAAIHAVRLAAIRVVVDAGCFHVSKHMHVLAVAARSMLMNGLTIHRPVTHVTTAETTTDNPADTVAVADYFLHFGAIAIKAVVANHLVAAVGLVHAVIPDPHVDANRPVTAKDRAVEDANQPVDAKDRAVADANRPEVAKDRAVADANRPAVAKDRAVAVANRPVVAKVHAVAVANRPVDLSLVAGVLVEIALAVVSPLQVIIQHELNIPALLVWFTAKPLVLASDPLPQHLHNVLAEFTIQPRSLALLMLPAINRRVNCSLS